ncbi:MAG: carbonic anhydrase [Woeseiaceae bacterium]|nr:carbonic anhydrase [Woeseiaceae bacterium]
MISIADALKRLQEGNRRFVSGKVSEKTLASRKHNVGVALPQKPFAIILACSDSRVPTELIFDCGIGDLFVIRVAGNIASSSQIGSIEYAAKQFGTRLVVVLGHSNCGAVIATLRELALKESHRSPNLRAIVDNIRPALESVLKEEYDADAESVVASCVRANIRASVDSMQQGSIILRQLIEKDQLRILGAEYSIETGFIDFFEDD